MDIRVGVGWDIHRLERGLPLVLGGVEIPHTHGLRGHSDADALTHAAVDALLGAASLGDIGTLFPDTDPAYEGADSLELLKEAARRVRKRFAIMHIDSTVKAQMPLLRPHIPKMRKRMAEAAGIEIERMSVKAKTGERVGPVGRGEAIEAEAAATLRLIEGASSASNDSPSSTSFPREQES